MLVGTRSCVAWFRQEAQMKESETQDLLGYRQVAGAWKHGSF